MRDELRNHIERLKTLVLDAKHAIEQAEAKVEQFNSVVHQIGTLGVVPREAFLGKAVSQPYDSEAGISDSGLVIQAALLIPEGFGVCRFDTEEYFQLKKEPHGVEQEARVKFVPFAECDRAEKAFLNHDINALFEKFVEFAAR